MIKFTWILLLLPTLAFATEERQLPEIKLTRAACEKALLQAEGKNLLREAKARIESAEPRPLRLDVTRIVGSLAAASSAPFEFFDEDLQGASFAELIRIMKERQARGWSEVVKFAGDAPYRPLSVDELRQQAEASLAAHYRQPADVLAKAALGISAEANVTRADLKSVHLSVREGRLYLTTLSPSAEVLGEVSFALDTLRLGYPNDLAEWQGHRFYDDSASYRLASAATLRRHFFRGRGGALLERQVGNVRIGFHFNFYPLFDRPDRPRISISLKILRDCPRDALARGVYIYPAPGSAPHAPALCGIRSDYDLITPQTAAESDAWLSGLQARIRARNERRE